MLWRFAVVAQEEEQDQRALFQENHGVEGVGNVWSGNERG